jgi:hypothetical protein
MVYEFEMNKHEIEAAEKWTSDHVCAPSRWQFWRTKGVEVYPHFTYSFSQTAIGKAVTVSCHCGAKKDVTDYSSW